jgi:hypothetical protein
MPRRRSYLSLAESAALKREVAAMPPDLTREFERRYAAQRKTWSDPHLSILSDPGVLRFLKEFADLAALSPQILPLVVAKLAQPDEFFALQLYDALQNTSSLRVDLSP